MLSSVQILRAMAAWAVVFHHYMQLSHGFESSNALSRFFSVYGFLGVDLFFIISGLVIYISVVGKTISPASFAIQRVARIAPAYWVFTILTAALAVVFDNLIPKTSFDSVHFFKSIFFIPAYSPSGIGLLPTLSVGWTLNYEMVFYSLFSLSLFLPRKALIPAMTIAIAVLQITAANSDGAFSFYCNPLIYNFIAGMCISVIYRLGATSKISAPAAAMSTLASLYFISLIDNIGHDPIKVGIPLAVIFIAFVSQENRLKVLPLVKTLGDWSYSTYLVHVLVICVALKLSDTYNLNESAVISAIIAMTVLASWASYVFIEKPTSNFLKRKAPTKMLHSQASNTI